MRVAYVASAPFISGAERSLQTTIQSLPTVGIEPIVICPGRSPLVQWCRANDVEVAACPLPLRDRWHVLRWIRGVRTMRGILKRRRVQLVHSNQLWSYPTPGRAALDLGLPRFCHIRDECSREALAWFMRTGAEGIISVSRHIGDQVRRSWPATLARPRLWTVLNAVKIDSVLLDPIQSLGSFTSDLTGETARAELGLGPAEVAFGFIGQVAPVKGLLPMLDAVARLPRSKPWRLVVAGRDPHGGGYYQECVDRVAALGLTDRVLFIGFLEDTSRFYRAIDVAVVPSQEEPMGRIPVEAGSFGKPTIAFAVGGLPEVVLDGVTGWLVPAGDFGALRDRMERFLESGAAGLGEAARDWAARTFDPQVYVKRLRLIYDDALQNRRLPSRWSGRT